jgi:hypothetical protein
MTRRTRITTREMMFVESRPITAATWKRLERALLLGELNRLHVVLTTGTTVPASSYSAHRTRKAKAPR